MHELKYVLICSDSQVGVLRVWNVSKTTPIDNFKLKKTGFHALHVLNSPPKKKSEYNKKLCLGVCKEHLLLNALCYPEQKMCLNGYYNIYSKGFTDGHYLGISIYITWGEKIP